MTIWWGRRPDPGSAPSSLVEMLAFGTDEQPDGVRIDLVGEPPAEPMIRVLVDGSRVLTVQVPYAASSPPLWYVEHAETSARPPAYTLVAFETGDFPDGTIVDEPTFSELAVGSDQQVGAVRWWPKTGQIHQVYVQPAHRRRGIARKLTLAAGGYNVGRGWAPMWVSGERTELGEAVVARAGSALRGRITPRTQVMPPMTPPGA
ncbi:MAG TPA: GNAT family N-acetyltransferase [Mycobacteriales bacterium]|nr:GNAT family N-acetyltransferase [Mycobacteriales bacterium]